MFKEVTKLEQDDIILRPNCKFCTHPLRREAETKWEQTHGSYAPVQRMFEKWEAEHPDEPKMNFHNIRNHLLQHYAKQEKKLWLHEYANECKAYMNYKISQDRRFEMLRAVMEKQLFDIGSDVSLDPIKQSDQLVKIGKMILEIDECQAKLRGDLKPVNVITERFMNVWLHVINNQDDESVRRKLMKALDDFQGQVQGGIVINE